MKIIIYLAKKAYIVLLIIEKVSILVKYFQFIKIFLNNFITQLLRYNKINKKIIKLEKNKQLFYKLKTLKTNIKTNLINNFIYLLKSSISILILFFKNQTKIFTFISIIKI